MLSYASGPSTLPLLGETIGENLRRTVERHGDSEALVVPHQNYRATYRQLWDQVSLVARGLLGRGVGRGDRVGIWSPNRFEWVVTQYATARIGAILVNINPAYRTTELAYALAQSGVSFLVLAREFRQADYVHMLGDVRGTCPALREALVLEDAWDSLLRDGRDVSEDALAAVESRLQFDDPINIQFTSGTTGFPKGATLSHHNILNNGFFVGEAMRLHARGPARASRCRSIIASAWSSGNLACTTHGACMVVPGGGVRSADAMLAAVAEQERCTSLYGVPTMFIAELDHPEFEQFDLTPLRTGIMAGSPCPIEVMKRCSSRHEHARDHHRLRHDRDIPVSTRAHSTIRSSGASRRSDASSRISRSRSSTRDGRIVPRGTPGELLHPRLFSVMLGYWDDEAAHPRGDRRARLDAHRRPRHHRRRAAIATSSAASRTWSSAAARTSIRARSRNFSTAIRKSRTCR